MLQKYKIQGSYASFYNLKSTDGLQLRGNSSIFAIKIQFLPYYRILINYIYKYYV